MNKLKRVLTQPIAGTGSFNWRDVLLGLMIIYLVYLHYQSSESLRRDNILNERIGVERTLREFSEAEQKKLNYGLRELYSRFTLHEQLFHGLPDNHPIEELK